MVSSSSWSQEEQDIWLRDAPHPESHGIIKVDPKNVKWGGHQEVWLQLEKMVGHTNVVSTNLIHQGSYFFHISFNLVGISLQVEFQLSMTMLPRTDITLLNPCVCVFVCVCWGVR